MSATVGAGSPSIAQPDYWWYKSRADLLRTILEDFVGEPEWLLDVGSADGPSVGWLRGRGRQVALDIDPRGLPEGGVCGSALALPFADESFDVVAAFDVIEHCNPESAAFNEFARVLKAGGRLLFSVPAYQWAWTQFDDVNGHYRRYTRRRAVRAAQAAGLKVVRATYAFMSVFPIFAVSRISTRLREMGAMNKKTQAPGDNVVRLPPVSPLVERVLMGLSRVDQRLLQWIDLPFGSSVVAVARKPARIG